MQKSYRYLLTGLFLLYGTNTLFAQTSGHTFNGSYQNENLPHIAFPIGGMGAGMFCLEGTGAVSHMSVRNSPDVFNEPVMFAAIAVKGKPGMAKVLEGPVPDWKKFGQWEAARGAEGTTFGLARFREAAFKATFPSASVTLKDKEVALNVVVTAWSPFIPTDADNSSLPVAGLIYSFKNTGHQSQSYVFSYNAKNFMALQDVRAPVNPAIGPNVITKTKNGFLLSQNPTQKYPEQQGHFAIWTEDKAAVDYCWFRGGWYDPLSMAWNKISKMNTSSVEPVEKNAPGASLYVAFSLKPGEEKTIRVMMAWYVPDSHLRNGAPLTKSTDSAVRDKSKDLPSLYHKPWYSSRFSNIQEVMAYWKANYEDLYQKTRLFSDAFYRSTLPPEVTEAVAANLTILKSPTVLRQYDGRFWAWEGSNDNQGSCAGSCTHVWNYAQALPHLFPDMERSIRETEYNEDLDSLGHQNYRAALPIRPAGHGYYFPAADGQLGSIMRTYRDWRISGNDAWLKDIYPKVKRSLDYCIKTWDPRGRGALEEPHHNTYDTELWGPDGMCTGFYLGALEAMIKMGEYLKENVLDYQVLYGKGKAFMEKDLFNGQYFIQKIQWTGLNSSDPVAFAGKSVDGGEQYSPEAIKLLEKEGPKYQYGDGCLSDGVIGAWMAKVCGLSAPFNEKEIRSHLMAVFTYNEKKDLTDYSNPQRPSFALGNEGGLLLCSWPNSDKLSLPFPYSNEVWTGIEYEVASHLIFEGKVKEGLDIVRTCRRRYDGTVRNPFDEYECGHWYARAMSSYALIEALTGVRYDAVDKTLYVDSKVGDFTSFLSTNTGFGNVNYKNGKATVTVAYGTIDVQQIKIVQ
jgi:uncharacterized protein (DUF608 family)